MDAAQDFIPQVTDPETQINDFVVTGYSKRGWTTWLTAAVDDRVRGIIPGVFDNPNQGPQMVHHYAVYGFFSEAVAGLQRPADLRSHHDPRRTVAIEDRGSLPVFQQRPLRDSQADFEFGGR